MAVVLSFGVWVGLRRRALRLTQHEVAGLVGCSLVLIRKIETDARRPSQHIAERLAHALHVAPRDLPAFVRAARAELVPDRLPQPDHDVTSPLVQPALLLNQHSAGNLPAPISSFVGRRREIDHLRELLKRADLRLLTFTGAGGSGKTRLALEVARTLAEAVPDGIWLVDLASVTDPLQVLRTMMQVLGIGENAHTPPREHVIAWLRPRHIMLVIDNFEHLLGAAPLISDLLRAAPLLRVLVTSRVPLRLQGEHEYLVEPLAIPPQEPQPRQDLTQYDAVQLFIARAQAVRADFALTVITAPLVAAICARLDGLPLAIELAAVRIRIFSPEHLLARLMAARIQTLTGGARDLPARQQTIQATIDWSYHLLTPSQQTLLARLSVFVGGWTLAAAEALGHDDPAQVVQHLEQLVAHSLVWIDTTHNPARFTMLETIHAYARERLREQGEEPLLQERHASYYVTLAERIHPDYWWPPTTACIAALDQEVNNFRAVLRWSLATHTPQRAHDHAQEAFSQSPISLGVRLIITTHQYWELHGGRTEGHQWLTALYAQSSALPLPLRLQGALALVEIAKFYDQPGALAVIQTIEPWVAQVADQHVPIWFYCNAGWVVSFCTMPDNARIYWSSGLSLAREQQHPRWEAEFLTNLGAVTRDLGQFAQSEQFLRAGLELSRSIGDSYQIGESLAWLTHLMVDQGHLQQAYRFASECVDVARQNGNRRTLGIALERAGFLLLEQGNVPAGEESLREAIVIARSQGNTSVITRSLYYLGRLRLAAGDLFGAEALLRESALLVRHPARPVLQLERQLRHLLFGWIAAARGDMHHAAHCYRESLRVCQLEAYPYGVAVMLETIAALASHARDLTHAARFWGAADVLREAHTSAIRPLDRFTPEVSGLAEAHTALGDDAFDAAWEAGCTLNWKQAATEALAWLEQMAISS